MSERVLSSEALRGYLRKAAASLESAHGRIAELEQRDCEPIAIVGMSCRYPGGVSSPEELWRLVASGSDAISPFPADRGWDLDALYDPDPDHPGTSYTREGGFLRDAGEFDCEFFSISPREALAMDPQQRLVLEGAWEAFEDAGIDPLSLRGGRTGVFVGVVASNYGLDLSGNGELEGLYLTGNTTSVVSGRLAYTFGLEGPAVSIDTACSSSLVAIHLASQALRQGECELALAGGVTVMASPGAFIVFSRQRGLSPDGRCKSFGEGADGVGWSEGVGLLVLERLADARANGHTVLATVRGSAVNQDGASNGLTAPNGPSQERVIMQALAASGLSPRDIDAVEAHGTGTTLGDPIEAGALIATYGQERPGGVPVWLGSVKSNIGHTVAAAGVAGVIKMVKAMEHGLLPRTLHAQEPSAHVDWQAGAVSLLQEQLPWRADERPRRAGVSSFGISGTNAHVIIEEPPAPTQPTQAAPHLPDGHASLPFLLSARSEQALRAQARRLHEHLSAHPETRPADLAGALALERAQLPHRAVAIATDRAELLGALDAISRGEPAAGLFEGRARREGKLAFCFTGQGSQWPGMGGELYESFAPFRESLDALCQALAPHLERPLQELMFAAEGSAQAALLDQTQYTQPAIFALEVSLYRLLGSLGITPDYLIGHSIGELSAAHLAGILSLEDAATLVAARARLMGALPSGGAMLAIEATEEEAAEMTEGLSGVAIAAINAPHALVLSGAGDAIEELARGCRERDRRSTRLNVSHAFHSPLMEPMLGELSEIAKGLSFKAPALPVISNVSGQPLSAEEATSPEYWVTQVRQPVRFAAGIGALEEAGVTRFLELGPDGALCAILAGCLGEELSERALVAPALRARSSERHALSAFLAQAHVHGIEVDWRALLGSRASRRIELPTYAFQKKRYWIEAGGGAGDAAALGARSLEHPLLGAVLGLAGEKPGWLFTARLSLAAHPWLAEHALMGTAIFPGTGFLELALAAGAQVGAEMVEELTLEEPLVLDEEAATQLELTLGAPDEAGRRELAIYSRRRSGEGEDSPQEAQWTRHASGLLGPAPLGQVQEPGARSWPPPGAEALDVRGLYERLAGLGYDYGPAFQGLRAAWSREQELFAEVELAEQEAAQAGRYVLHPALADAALHAVLHAALAQPQEQMEMRLPFTLSGVRVQHGGAGAWRVRLAAVGDEAICLQATDEHGNPTVSIDSLRMRALPPDALARSLPGAPEGLYIVNWDAVGDATTSVPEPLPDAPVEIGLGDDLRALGEPPALVLCRLPVAPEAVSLATAARQLTLQTLELLKAFLVDERLARSRLVLLTERAVAAGEHESPSLAQAPVWGLLRSAQLEHPERFALIDSDGSDASRQALAAALASEEPQLAIRDGRLLAPRLADAVPPSGGYALDPAGTLLITGATGMLGALVARHLVGTHGVRHLLLLSRRGAEAPGAEELRGELEELGASVQIVACDVSRRDQLEAAIAQIPPAHPLVGIVHAAGALSDGVISSLDGERLESVFTPKVDAAINLHELTRDMQLGLFMLFSSAAGTIGSPGQANYAAANAFLDALAQHRRSQGLPAQSVAWGLWEQRSEMTAVVGDVAQARLGGPGLSLEQGLTLLDRALAASDPFTLAMSIDRASLQVQARAGMLPALLRSLVRAPARATTREHDALARRLGEAPEEQWDRMLLELVTGHVAAVLGHPSAAVIDPELPFKELGFDSLSAVELRNSLALTSGIRLPATLVFDHPTPLAVARHLREQVEGRGRRPAVRRRSPSAAEEPIAIVGMSCRYPGGVSSPEELWQLVASGSDAISPFPADRGWELERLYDPDPDHPGTSYTREGGFLRDAGEFDCEFFSISPREAIAMDPQQRQLLEAAWEAFEDAGIDPRELRGSPTGVYAGFMYSDYGAIGPVGSELEDHMGAAAGGSVISGRLAYTFGLEGPAVSIDTACSSSLVAIHLASQALRQGECELALAGGVTVLSTPFVFIVSSRQRGLSPDGRCKSFGEGADGVGWSEGVGLLVLERLADARANGHTVLATVRGSAVNQDGASNGLTAPNGPSQERVIMQALAASGLSPRDIDAVEAHGTGTTLGDPIEAGALIATYGQEREHPLHLGSLKSNIGHAQAAAGVAGVIKMVKAMEHGLLPRTLHAQEPSAHVDWQAGAVSLLQEQLPWRADERPRRAGVSSFGISGTNAHVIIEEPPAPTQPTQAAPHLPDGHASLPFLLSARSEQALRAQARRLHEHLSAHPETRPADLAGALALERAQLPHRAVAIATDRAELLGALDAISRGEPAAGLFEGRARREGKLAFCFTGQGSQWPGMGGELYESFAPFRESLDALCQALAPHLERPLQELMFAAEGSAQAALLDQTQYTQPAIFALEVSLYRLLGSLGITPDYLIGHSIGELSAAHLAGILSLEDAATLVAARARLMGALPSGGAMLAIEATEEEAAEMTEGLSGVAIAAINAPHALVLSGAGDAIEELARGCRERDRRSTRLNVSHAFHSPLMEPMLGELSEIAKGLSFKAPALPVISNVSGQPLSAEEATSPEYWVTQVRQPVRFAAGIGALEEAGVTRFLELGPDGALCAILAGCLGEELSERALVAPALRARSSERHALSAFLAQAHVHGIEVDWRALLGSRASRRIELPTYAFQKKRYWIEAGGGAGDAAALGARSLEHPLLGAVLGLAGEKPGWLFTARLSLAAHPWLAEHALMGTAIFPGTGFLELALAAGAQVGAEMVEELTLEEPLVLDEEAATQLELVLFEDATDGRYELAIYSRPEGPSDVGLSAGAWQRHATGVLAPARTASEAAVVDGWPPEGADELEARSFYERLAEAGYEYGPAFQGLQRAWSTDEAIYAEVHLDDERSAAAGGFCIHPALADAALHALILRALETGQADAEGEVGVPFSFVGVRVFRRGACRLHVRIGAAEGAQGLSVTALDDAGAPVLAVDSLRSRPIDSGALRRASRHQDALYELSWSPVPVASANGSSLRVALLGEARQAEAIGAEPYADLAQLQAAISAGAPVPELILAGPACSPQRLRQATARGDGELLRSAHEQSARTLELLKAFLTDERLADARLALLTRAALCVREGEAPDLAQAALAGLMRSAVSEHPGRFCLLDIDGGESPLAGLYGALLSDEPQLALREGAAYAPRLLRTAGQASAGARAFDPERTVLITGGTGGLGALLARHLAAKHAVRELLLISRRGLDADGARELRSELAELGCRARIERCDVSDREALAGVFAAIPDEHPLGAVIHAAGVLENGLIESLDEGALRRTMAPKLDGAAHLHELTKDRDLSAFVLFSSVAATWGGPGQANYAAANAFLDALAQHRRAQALPGQSLVWGPWAANSGLSGALDEHSLMRLSTQIRTQLGLDYLSPEQGLRLFDAACVLDRPVPVLARLNAAALRAQERDGVLPAILRSLVRASGARAAEGAGQLAQRLAQAPEAEWDGLVLELVRAHVAAVLGHASADAVDPQRSFKELGFDSLSAVELRNRLARAGGVKLPPTLVFDHPTPLAVAEHLRGQVRAASIGAATHVGGGDTPGTLTELLRHAHGGDKLQGVLGVLVAAAGVWPTAETTQELSAPSRLVRIADGPEPPELICVPSFVNSAGPYQFLRLANALGARRQVSVLSLPGSRDRERLPGSWRLAVEALAESVASRTPGGPFVLVGYSVGGAIAHALAEQLEAAGNAPSGLVLLDTYTPDDDEMARIFPSVIAHIVQRDADYHLVDDRQLIAMGAYTRLLGEWTPGSIGAPTLLVSASQSLDGSQRPYRWQVADSEAQVAADHFTLVEERAPETAGAIETWLGELATVGSTSELGEN